MKPNSIERENTLFRIARKLSLRADWEKVISEVNESRREVGLMTIQSRTVVLRRVVEKRKVVTCASVHKGSPRFIQERYVCFHAEIRLNHLLVPVRKGQPTFTEISEECGIHVSTRLDDQKRATHLISANVACV
jgi:hypothetical protein